MSDPAQWQANNDRYLGAALHWLRLALLQMARQNGAEPSMEASHLGLAREKERNEEIAKAAAIMTEAASAEPPPTLVILARRMGLSTFEQEILLLCAAMEFDTRIPGLCAQAQGDAAKPYPTFALALSLFDQPGWEALSPERPLRYWRLIEINQPPATPLIQSVLRADERIVHYLKGLNQLDDRLTVYLSPFALSGKEMGLLSEAQQATVESMVSAFKAGATLGRPSVLQLLGMDELSKQQVALQVFSRVGVQGLRLPGELLPTNAGELESLARLWQREGMLLPLALYLDAQELDEGQGSAENPLRFGRFIERCGLPVLMATREPRAGLGIDAPSFIIEKPLPMEQAAIWETVLNGEAGALTQRLAGQFNLNLPGIHQIALSINLDNLDSTSQAERLWQACLCRTRPSLDRLAQRIECKADWNQLVLPEEAYKRLQEIAAQVRQRSQVYDGWGFRRRMSRGLGISALFAGESGTGKTMAAEVLAGELQLDLYRIDLSAVVSKYIGETEKNLRRIFDAAEDGGVILLFDEADALFGKRSEVRDSHDRYANIEVNYLLQRMEAFGGLAILATNLKSALDQAFLRRLRFIVSFAFPGKAERRLIWQRIFPENDAHDQPGTPLDGIDYDHLARFNLTGGSIQNAALNSAFLAAQAGTPVTMPLLFEAVRTEFRKLEKPVNERDFRPEPTDGGLK
ncbi:ATP-binding protein [uncultured Desulfobacter sp.]|uniref:ATP-binding protein n=1 Tax=uncultured Desulfobacter sp. TaxID=240139 RepID=UPI002AA63E53|nr:ATP-binding protein [uncultured Desulfobacter sp.]